ncbi:MAG: DEAD/DEAH box helicase [Rubrivivax sp.]|uniref:DEAD/DEAH box helicase n=1 Tax=Ottowia sp. TaxID=1898956 RepID=UPI0021797A7D|nr:DEAD/DEAH box helicase [Ottowia sp.]MCC6812768.1 DEAD/DEAH box helicase [Rubrivivax sp.]MCZ2090162.1 DEAD/DEAH box helicase [Burkholderiales bacterium]HNR84156.1 DEAD/DEAH box helicase [Ottowia sp.]HNT85618.1 DEAD/DEAH box helicase [Ottowia sp.]HOZ94082.1 DEAD/DEAH box helicase [Ottowia sp.]
MSFESLNLAPAILRAVQEQGYTEPTPIQAQAIPVVLQGHDLLAGAQTGTGKTAGFTLPMLHLLNGRPARRPGAIRALVLTPTRELAAQVEESVRTYGQHLSLKSTVIFGGVGMNPQIERIRAGVDILVATPGRLLDLEGQDHIDLSGVEILVLDEADRMLDMGFIHDVKKVLALLPADKQSLLFSATFSDDIRELAAGLLRNPRSIQVTPPNTTVERIRQAIYPVGRNRKKDVLAHLIGEGQWSQVLVFTRTKFGANKVADYLNERGIKAMALHGNKSQSARTQALADFKSGELRALVATDIAARGIDIDELPHVVNYDIPNVPEDYVHRIGRTGRAGASGEAVSLVCMDEEGFMHEIERFTRQQIPVRILDGFGPEEGERAEPIAMGRQTLWGGLGKPPSREVMQAAARAARQEMMQRIRDNKAAQGQRGRAAAPGRPAPARAASDGPLRADDAAQGDSDAAQGRAPQGAAATGERTGRSRRRRGRGGAGGVQGQRPGSPAGAQAPRAPQARATREFGFDDEDDRDLEHLPRHIDPLQTNLHGRRSAPRGPSHGAVGQPDPMRTSIDLMGRGKGGGGRNKSRKGGFGR